MSDTGGGKGELEERMREEVSEMRSVSLEERRRVLCGPCEVGSRKHSRKGDEVKGVYSDTK